MTYVSEVYRAGQSIEILFSSHKITEINEQE